MLKLIPGLFSQQPTCATQYGFGPHFLLSPTTSEIYSLGAQALIPPPVTPPPRWRSRRCKKTPTRSFAPPSPTTAPSTPITFPPSSPSLRRMGPTSRGRGPTGGASERRSSSSRRWWTTRSCPSGCCAASTEPRLLTPRCSTRGSSRRTKSIARWSSLLARYKIGTFFLAFHID